MKDKILIVDDDEGVRQVLGEILAAAGYQATGVDSAEKAIASVRESQFDLVILDMVLPRIDGLAVLREMGASGRRCRS